jgi:hypothetical protein
MDEKQLKLICICTIAAGIRANRWTMDSAWRASERGDGDVQHIVAMWATSQFEFIEEQLRKTDMNAKRE